MPASTLSGSGQMRKCDAAGCSRPATWGIYSGRLLRVLCGPHKSRIKACHLCASAARLVKLPKQKSFYEVMK